MIPVQYLRSSMHGTHEMCEQKFFIEYVLGWTGQSGLKADKGTIVHKIMEILAGMKLARQNGFPSWNDEIVGDVTLDDYVLEDIYDKVYSYYTEAFNHHEWEAADYRECKRWVHKALEYSNGEFDPRKQLIVQPEQRFDIELNRVDWAKYNYDGVEGYLKLKGTIDLIVQEDANTYHIVDYKTGKRLNWATGEEKTYEKLQNDFQLRFYHLAATILYPQIKNIMITIFFINDGGAFTLTFGQSDIPETLNQIRKKYEQIRDTDVPSLNYSWKCTKFCDHSKKTFEGTNVLPIVDRGQSKFTKTGQPMCRCDQVKYCFNYKPMPVILSNMSKDTHNMDNYKAPGATE